MKIRFVPLLALCGALAISSLSVRAGDTTTTTTTQTTVNALPVGAAPAFSGDIPEVVTLAKSGVDESVVVAFIRNSPGPFQPSANEILRLRDAGLTSTEISAMLERGAEVRAQTAAAAPTYNYASGPMPTTAPDYNDAAPAMPTTAAPPVVTTPPVTYADPGDSTQPGSTVVYIGGNSGYPYYYGGYPYYYPYPYPYFYPGIRVGIGFHGGFRGGFGGGFHGGFAGGFHGHGGRR